MIPDEDFHKDPTVPGPSKEEVRCLVMCQARVEKDEVVLEVGCGTGGLTVELSQRAAKVYAVDKNPQALEVTRTNLQNVVTWLDFQGINYSAGDGGIGQKMLTQIFFRAYHRYSKLK